MPRTGTPRPAVRYDRLSPIYRIVSIGVIAALLAPSLLIFTGAMPMAKASGARPSMPVLPSIPPSPFDFGRTDAAGPFAAGTFTNAAFAVMTSVIGVFSAVLVSEESEETPLEAVSETEDVEAPAMTWSQPAGIVDFDFDGDGKADVGRWNASATDFRIKNSNGGSISAYTIGSSSAKAAPGDFDGDGKTDAAVFNAGTWTIRKSSDSQTITISFGQSGDIPVPADYDGDEITDLAVFRPSNGTWYIRQSSTTNTVSTQFGASTDIPTPGNYDGDDKADIAVFRPSTGEWHILGSTDGYFGLTFGNAADIPVPADFDGDGKTDPAVFRPSTGTWYYLESNEEYASYDVTSWGNYGDQPVPADYDGDGKADHAVWRPSTGVWHIKKSSSGTINHGLGTAGDTAIPSAYIKQVGASLPPYALAKERLSPRNATGGTDLYSQNFGWGTSLVGLPGRAGLNAGFGMSYNSLVWTKEDTAVYFDTNNDNISPGFRLGFPVIEPAYFVPGGIASDPYWTYVMVTPSGGRIEFKQVGVTEIFETTDSSYLQIEAKSAPDPNEPIEDMELTVRGTDGTVMDYEWAGGAYRCREIKDRNGNYITIEHDELGLLRKVTDTLGREVEVNYSEDFFPTTITQAWKTNNGSGSATTHTWATFSYTTKTVATDFDGLTVVGPPNGWQLKVLDKVTYPDQSYTKFHHNGYAQVWKIDNHAADTTLLNSVRTDLESPAANQTDVPRFAAVWTKAANFNTDQYGAPQEIKTEFTRTPNEGFSLPGSLSGTGTLIEAAMDGHPYEAVSKTWYGETGWKEGLPLAGEDWAKPTAAGSFGLQRWTWTNWTQDDGGGNADAPVRNPRIVETRVGDGISTRKTMVDYLLYPSTTVSQFGLVEEVRVYDSDLSTVLKQQQTDYNFDSAYITRRIIGLPAETRSYGRETSGLNLMSKVTYAYDEGDFSDSGLNQNISPVQHDNTNYGSGFITGRGNLTSVTRWNAEYPTTSGEAVTSSMKYNTAGAMVSRTDPMSRTVKIGYADAWNDNPDPNRTTWAYPTSITDPADNSSTVKYRYDIGANVEATSPAPAGQTYGKTTKRVFDSIGRLEKNSVYVDTTEHSYVRYEYPTNGIQSKVYATLIDTNSNGPDAADEVLSESWTDGAGRVRFSRVPHTFSGGSTATWAATVTEYDILGRVSHQSVPVEVDGAWQPAGDDYTRGWLWTFQKYDWMGRVIRKIATDGDPQQSANDSDVFISYEGCGCAGGLVTTVEGELVPRTDTTGNARRKQKAWQDILGRTWKTQTYEWDGTTPYLTTEIAFNGRDQAVSIEQTDEDAEATQTTTMTYDGHGRLKTRHLPQQAAETATVYNYNADDSISSVVDARGAATHYEYNSRGLAEEISWTVPGESNIEVPTTVEFTYDNLGNRTQMTDGLGNVTYEYDSLSRLTAETRQFTDTLEHAPMSNNRFKLQYEYHLSGTLKSLTDPYGDVIYYDYDKVGRLDAVTGSSFGGVTSYASNPAYRAWGALKHLEYGNGLNLNVDFDARLMASAFEINHPTDTEKEVFGKEYEYYNDGRLKYIKENFQDQAIRRFDRAYTHDQVGRVKVALSGAEANGGTQSDLLLLPYRQSYNYNAFGMLTERQSTLWTNEGWNFQDTYVDNRRTTGWTYDYSGNTTYADGIYFDYDAKTRLVKTWRINSYEMTIAHDGLGREGKRSQRLWDPAEEVWKDPEVNYFIYSSVLGLTLSEAGETGKKKRTFVYAAGTIMARQFINDEEEERVSWEFSDASGQSIRMISSDGTPWGADDGGGELDALGNNVGTHGSLTDPRNSEGEISPANRSPISPEAICNKGGLSGPCHLVNWYIRGVSIASSGSDLPHEMTRTGDSGLPDRHPFYNAFYGNSINAFIDDGVYVETPGGDDGGGDACSGGVCPDVVTITGYPSTFSFIPPASRPSTSGEDCPDPPCFGAGAEGRGAGNCGVNPVTGQPGINRDPTNATGNIRSDRQGGGTFDASRRGVPGAHKALDIAGVLNQTPVLAPFSGVITFSRNAGSRMGQTVIIKHDNGMESHLAHMKAGSLIALMTNGRPTRVNAGDQIGIMGNTGNANLPGMQAHVHWILKDKPGGNRLDPEAVLNSPCPE